MKSIDALLRDNPLVIVDIGASGGIDRRWTDFTSAYRGILFEPDPREFERLRAHLPSNLLLLNAALSDAAGGIDFHLCRKQQTSSAFLPNLDFLRRYPQLERFDITRTVRIDADTLDNQLAQQSAADIDFIKIDTQGYELPILRGAAASLACAVGMQIEVAFAPMYRDQPLFADVDTHVRAQGFELFDLEPHYWPRAGVPGARGQLIFGDALYLRPPERLAELPELGAGKAMRALSVYLAYERTDIARMLLQGLRKAGITLTDADMHAAEAAIIACERQQARRDVWRLRRLRHLLAKWFKRLQQG
jgi:FkbM family methyltransferase